MPFHNDEDADRPNIRRRSLSRKPGYESDASTRIKWIFFVLGICALLPWNGEPMNVIYGLVSQRICVMPVVMINEMTYFVSKLEHSAYQDAFPCYLSATMSLANFAFLTHATFYATPAPSSIRINKSFLTIIAMLVILTVSPIFPFTGGIFFSIIILNGIIQSAAGSYFQTAVVGIGALFGAGALQSLFSGHGEFDHKDRRCRWLIVINYSP